MNELITITTGEQGQPVVSARELYDFLGFDASQWSRWAKKNIINNPYAKRGDDWAIFDIVSKNLEAGRPTTDYVLTLDFAKRLSMLARTEKGEAIRRYFLDCEGQYAKLTYRPLAESQTQMLSRLSNLEKIVHQLVDREQFRLQLEQPTRYPLAVETTRAKVAQLVNRYAESTRTAGYVVWNRVWDRLHLLYGFNVRIQRKTSYENLLDIAERYGQLERIYKIVSDELNLPQL